MRNLSEGHQDCRSPFGPSFQDNLFLYKPFIIPRAFQPERPRLGRLPACNRGDHIRARDPVSFSQICRRPLRSMIRMGVVKADNFQPSLSGLPLNSDKLLRINGIAILQRVAPNVIATDGGHNAWTV